MPRFIFVIFILAVFSDLGWCHSADFFKQHKILKAYQYVRARNWMVLLTQSRDLFSDQPPEVFWLDLAGLQMHQLAVIQSEGKIATKLRIEFFAPYQKGFIKNLNRTATLALSLKEGKLSIRSERKNEPAAETKLPAKPKFKSSLHRAQAFIPNETLTQSFEQELILEIVNNKELQNLENIFEQAKLQIVAAPDYHSILAMLKNQDTGEYWVIDRSLFHPSQPYSVFKTNLVTQQLEAQEVLASTSNMQEELELTMADQSVIAVPASKNLRAKAWIKSAAQVSLASQASQVELIKIVATDENLKMIGYDQNRLKIALQANPCDLLLLP